jgi:hypothetical protein
MLDIETLASQVKFNCNISDAKYWGYYSPCGLLLRLRDLYTTEKEIKLTLHNGSANVRHCGKRLLLLISGLLK